MTTSKNVPGNAGQPTDTESIRAAVSNRDLSSVERLLRETPDLAQAKTKDGVSLLLSAKYVGADDIANLIAAARDDLDIFEASATGNLLRVHDLVAMEWAMLEQFSPDGFTPLHLAVFFKHAGVARFLLANGANADVVARNSSAVRPIHSAAATRDAGTVRVILAAGADPNARQAGGHTALHSAILHRNVPMVIALLAAGTDPTIGNDKEQSPMEMAESVGDDSIKNLVRTYSEYYAKPSTP